MNSSVTNVQGKIVVGVDDDFRVRESMTSLLESAGLMPLMFESGEDFLKSGILAEASCLITDVRMHGMDGLELQRRIRVERPRLPVIFISAHGNDEVRHLALDGGAIQFLCKPFDGSDLLRVIEHALLTPSKD